MTYGTLDGEKGKAAKPRGRRIIVAVAAVAALALLGLTAARGASLQGKFIKLPHKPPKVPTPPTPTPPTKPVTNTIPNHVPPVPPVPTASCTKLCPQGLLRGAVLGSVVSTCLQPKALFCEAACAKPVPNFLKFHGDCCPQGSWTAAATPRMTQLRDDCCDCK